MKKETKHIFSTKNFYKHPITMLITILAITLFFGLQIIRLNFDNNNFRFIPKNDPSRISAKKIADIFGEDVPILIGIERHFSTIVDKEFLDEIRKLDKSLKEIDLVKNTVLITDTTHIDIGEEGIVSEPIIPADFSGTEEEIKAVERKLRSWDMYDRSLVSEDLHATQILVFLNITNEESGSPETIAACRKIMKLTQNWNFPDSKIYLTGAPIFNEIVNEATAHDLSFLVPLVIIVVVGVLFLSFKRFTGVFLPLLTVITSVIWALGAMALFNVPLSILSTILPIILIAVGSAYGIHVINHYYDEVVQDNSISKEEHKGQVIKALSEVIRPVFLASLTTFAGFVSFCFTSVIPIFEFGIFASFGVAAAFLISITLIPSILILRGPKKPSMRWADKKDNTNRLDRGIATTFILIAEHYRSVILFTCLIVVLSILGVKQLVIDNVLMEYFDEDVAVIQSDVFMRKQFGGSKLLEMVIKTEDGSSVLRPDILKSIDNLSLFLEEEVDDVGKVTSIVPLIKRLNQVYNADESPEGIRPSEAGAEEDAVDDFGSFDDFGNFEMELGEGGSLPAATDFAKKKQYTQEEIMEMLNEAAGERTKKHISAESLVYEFGKRVNYKGLAYYEIPSDPKKYGKNTQEDLSALMGNYLILLGKNTEGFLDNNTDPKTLKVNIQLRTVGQQDTDRVLEEINEFVSLKFPKDVIAETGGFVLVEKTLNKLVVESQLISVGVSLLIVFLILSIYYRSAFAGLFGIIPLALSILINFGIMGRLGIKLNIGTAMVASFAIGIGVDYTIHLLAAYHKCFLKTKGSGQFLYLTFLGSGKAILFNAVSVGAGFAVLMLSKFNMLAELGFLIALIMITSSLGSLTILPVLLNLVKPKFIRKLLPVDVKELKSEYPFNDEKENTEV
ncbi:MULTISPECIES: RND family transporter [unclassified Treponema]|uniref:efflux RND transporter permease subunit n=1 Tax=unclassified Treponema TaxID=2638727 RepID=UPI0020A32BC8|nr:MULTISPECIES: MMPL family transporter [unclassified Treponema]UTC67034.1 RND family transporter [Treponema sp. OMZ 789]UTC69765.1 RND family transporter [Treponema sp. OMZ 790]UTC72479.1 RND family transporter [Treponema sp. OMZ 791]